MEEDIMNLEGVESLQISFSDDGISLFVDRHDGSGVEIELTVEEFETLETTFMVTELSDMEKYEKDLGNLAGSPATEEA